MNTEVRIGDWKRIKELGSGGFGVVSLWVNHLTEESLAIKMCRLDIRLTEKQQSRWNLEVENMQKIDHDNVVHFRTMPDVLQEYFGGNDPTKLPILSMEYCSMGSLRNALVQPQNACGFSEGEVVEILSDTSSGLMHLHELKITHRDLKPDNVVLQRSASRPSGVVYKIIDLGYAKELDSGTVSFVGTLQYLAPEMFVSQRYTNSVDYWSMGITAFEIMCGFRPFLHTLPPITSLKHVQGKSKDVICIQMTHTGDIHYSTELLQENHLTECFKQKIVTWLRSVLQFKPEDRVAPENNDIFQLLRSILSTKIITVFSVYTLEFYSYEITSSTPSSKLQDWISSDLKLAKNEFFITSTRPSEAFRDSSLAINYYDETNKSAMLYVFKTDPTCSPKVFTHLPHLIRILFEGVTLEFKYGTLNMLYAQTTNFVFQQQELFKTVKNACCYLWDFLQSNYQKQRRLFNNINDIISKVCFETEFYNQIENSMIELYRERSSDRLKKFVVDFQINITELWKILYKINDLRVWNANFVNDNRHLEKILTCFLEKFDNCSFEELKNSAAYLYNELYQIRPTNKTSASPIALNLIVKTMKFRNQLVGDTLFLDFLKVATNYSNELSEVLNSLTSIKIKLMDIIHNLRKIQVEKFNFLLQYESGLSMNSFETSNSAYIQSVEEFLAKNAAKCEFYVKEMEEHFSVLNLDDLEK